MSSKQRVSIALDVEFEHISVKSGNILQLGFVVFLEDATNEMIVSNNDWIVDTLSVCFKSQGCDVSPNVMNFWSKFPAVYQRIQDEAVDIRDGFRTIQNWLNALYQKYDVVNFIADPACVDFQWFSSLYVTYCDQSLNTFSLPYKCICVSTMFDEQVRIFGLDGDEFWKYCSDSNRFPHTHYATEDAMECAYMYLRIVNK